MKKDNKIMEKMNFTPADDMKDELWGKRGTTEREEMETQLKAEIQTWHISEAIKKARLSKNLTQEQLGEIMGVKKAQISRIEKGSNLTISTISKAFRAMGISATLDIAGIGQIEL